MNQQQVYIQFLEALEEHWEEELTYKRNEYLSVAGDVATEIYWIRSGSLRVFVCEEEEHTIRFGYQNSIITALDSFITGTPSMFYIQALKKTELRVMSKLRYETLLEESPLIKEAWTELLKSFVVQQMERELDLITYAPQKRVERLLQRSPQVFQEIPLKYIASYTRMTPETLSRILKNLD